MINLSVPQLVRDFLLDNRKKKILITGITGFVGKNLLKYLKPNDNFSIYGVGRNLDKLESFVELDGYFLYDDFMRSDLSFDVYVHLAGQVIKKEESHSSDLNYRHANLDLTKTIYDRYQNDAKSEKFIFLSSIHVLTEKPECIVTENYPPKPFTPYGRSKYEAEQYIVSKNIEEKKYYILRPTMIHGPGNKGNLKSLYDYLITGYPYLFGAIDNNRSFLSIENLCFIITEIINNDIDQGLYHLADDEPTSTLELIHQIKQVTQKDIKVLKLPVGLLKFVAKIGNYLPIPVDEHRFVKLSSDFLVSNKKIVETIGKPLPVTAHEGMRRTIKSFIKNSD